MWVVYIVLGVLAGILLAVGITVLCCRRAAKKVLHPAYKRKPLYLWPDEFNFPYENFTFTTADGVSLKGWFIEANPASDKTIILMHGWGMNRSDILKNTYFLRDQGFNLCYFDFRAMGESGGKVSSIGYLETQDVKACIKYLKKHYPAQSQKIGLYGLSMGGMVALYEAAHNHEIVCVAAEASYFSFRRVVSRWAWVHHHVPYFPLLPIILHYIRYYLHANPEQYSPRFNIAKIAPRPVFIIHGRRDNLVPAVQAKWLYRSAGEPKNLWLVDNAKHGKCAEEGGFTYKQKLTEFFKQYL